MQKPQPQNPWETYATPDRKSARRAEAWRRFGLLMKLMFATSLLVLIGALAWLKHNGTPMPLPFLGAIAFAVIGSMMLTGALMGLVFFSAASGADDAAAPGDDPRLPK